MTRVITMPTQGVLLSDQRNRRIDLLRDLNGDGDVTDPGERKAFFDGSNASGIAKGGYNAYSFAQAADGTVFYGDGETETVYRLKDLNGDGDANDAGEASVWFSEAGNANGFTLPTAQSIAFGPDGAAYVLNAGNIGDRPFDAVYRTVDLNGDGDANDAGESSVWLDLKLANPNSSAFSISFIGEAAYILDLNGGDADTIYRAEDKDGSGDISADEITTFASEAGVIGDRFGFAATAQGMSILSFEGLNFSSGNKLWRLTDADGSGKIDAPGEVQLVWDASKIAAPYDMSVGFSVAVGKDGRVLLTSSGGATTTKDNFIAELTDLNGDGDYLDAGETVVIGGRIDDADGYGRARAVAYYEDGAQRSDAMASAGNHFSIFLDRTANTVYASGENIKGQLGNGAFGFNVKQAMAIKTPAGFDEKIVSVAAGMVHGSFLTESGDVYTWGQGAFGRLGLGDEKDRAVATKIEGALDDKKVVVLDHGNGASYAITEDGALYAWGLNASGQLGLGDEARRLVPTRVEALAGEKVIAVSAGTSHTLALTADGDLYAWGAARDGQLGAQDALDANGAPLREVLSPVKVTGLPNGVRVAAITADGRNSFAVLEDGRVYGWGENRTGQLLRGADNGDGTFTPDGADVTAPVELTRLPGGVVDVKAGARWGVALTKSGEVWAWGPNDKGPTGALDGDLAKTGPGSFYPVKISGFDGKAIIAIETGPNSILATATDGTIYSWGLNSDGRLGYASDGTVTTPMQVTFPDDAAPWLKAATPSDNARDVSAADDLELTFTEAVTAGTGNIRLINRDDGTVIEIDASDTTQVRIDGAKAVIDPSNLLSRDARYAVQIDKGAFIDSAGQAYAGIAASDEKSFNFKTAALNEIMGTDGADHLIGTDGDDRIVSGAGRSDRVTGGAGADVFVFGAETSNGVRETTTIFDYQAGADQIDLGGASVARVREMSSAVVLTLEGDGDLLILRGVSDFDDLSFA